MGSDFSPPLFCIWRLIILIWKGWKDEEKWAYVGEGECKDVPLVTPCEPICGSQDENKAVERTAMSAQ